MERRKFEDSFKDAFEGAEISPSDGVWTNIELDLEKADGSKIRRRLLFYKMLAAASVVFALGFAGIGYYLGHDNIQGIQEDITVNSSVQPGGPIDEASSNSIPANAEAPEASTNESSKADTHVVSKEKEDSDLAIDPINQKAKDLTDYNAVAATSPNGVTAENIVESQQNSTASEQHVLILPTPAFKSLPGKKGQERGLPLFHSPKKPELTFHKDDEPDPGAILLAKLADEEKKFAEEEEALGKEKRSERLWTSVGFAAGGFSSVNSSVSPTMSNSFLMSNNSTVADKQANASGVAYSYGLNVGTRLSKRWVLQGGVNYLIQSSDYTATNVVGGNNFESLKAESINSLDKLNQTPQVADQNAATLAPTLPYTVNNNVRFFSVPVQAGYLVVNKKFGVQLNAGVSTDLFLQNTITPEGGSLDKTTQGRGEDSPYRSVNFSGLMGTEFTYRFGQRYRVALNPGFRYPFNSVYKTDIGVESTPLTFDIGLRFRYIFQ